MSSLSAIVTSTSNESMIFPSKGMQLLSALIEFLGMLSLLHCYRFLSSTGISILAHCLSRRIASEELSSLRAFRSLTWARWCILLVFLDSWLFLITCEYEYHRPQLETHTSLDSCYTDFWYWHWPRVHNVLVLHLHLHRFLWQFQVFHLLFFK